MHRRDRITLKEFTYEYELQEDPNFLFLNSTLISSIRRRSRGTIGFFSARSWRTPLKALQLEAMRNLKKHPNAQAVRAIAHEIAECADTITNGRPYEFVCSVPGGSSCKTENFASLIARFVADELGVDFCRPLITVAKGRSSSSHPREAGQFRSKYITDVGGKFGLLVDDVVTSGAHFSNCVNQFRRHGKSVVCVSWIG